MLKHVPEFLEWMQDEGYSAHTRRMYRCRLTNFCAWLKDQGEEPLTLRRLQAYFVWLSKEAPNCRTDELGLRPRTARTILAALRLYRDWLERNPELNEALPDFRAIRPPKLDRPLREVPTTEEVRSLWATAEKLPAGTPYRLWRRTMLLGLLLFYCHAGLRREEALSLRRPDIREDRWLIHVRAGKGAQPRAVDLSKDELFQERYRTFLHDRERYLTGRDLGSPWLFHSIKQGFRLSDRGYQSLWAELLAAAGLDRHLTAHCLRHWYTSVIEPAGGIADVQAILGHRSPGTTLAYLHSLGRASVAQTAAAAGRELAAAPVRSRPAKRTLRRRIRG